MIDKNIENKIKSTVYQRLNPKPHFIALKFLVIHLFSAVLTLSVCPQFGKKMFNLNIDLMDFFMKITGPKYCLLLCGAFFIGTSLFINSILMNYDELRTIRSHRHLTVIMLVLLSFGSFLMFDPILFLESTMLWFAGALAGGYLSLEFGDFLKRKIAFLN